MLPAIRSWIGSGLLAVGLTTAQMAHGQEETAKELTAQPMPSAREFAPPDGIDALIAPGTQLPHRFWVGTDYLLWWNKSASVPPLLTRGAAGDIIPGALGQPGTVVLFGGNNVDYGSFSGVRVNGGANLDADGNFAVEGSFIMLGSRSRAFSAQSNSAGSPVLARPLTSAFGNGEFVEQDSSPGQFSGGANISTSSRFSAWDVDLSTIITSTDQGKFSVLAGFRQLSLIDQLTISDSLTPFVPNLLTFLGAPISPPSTLSDFDHVRTSNQFFGGQIGGSYIYQMSKFSFEATGKIALGVTQQLISMDGATTLATPGAPPVTVPGGILAQPTNFGTHYRQVFAVVPEGDLAVSYQITPWLQAKVGYSIIYWTHVVRPGGTIDRTVNVNQVPSDQAFHTLQGGQNRPEFIANESDFWAQGFNFGLCFTY
jgi:hypothetical protein